MKPAPTLQELADQYGTALMLARFHAEQSAAQAKRFEILHAEALRNLAEAKRRDVGQR